MKVSRISLIVVSLFSLALTGCLEQSSRDLERQSQENATMQAVRSVGMPAIVNYQEKKNLKQILELRDQAKYQTITYITDLNGHIHKVCDSVGYGIPYATQYTNPSSIDKYGSGGYVVLPQADPNGLYSPSSAEGTWVQCLDPSDKTVKIVYLEPRIVVSPFPLDVK